MTAEYTFSPLRSVPTPRQEGPLDSISAIPASFFGESQFAKLFGRPCRPDAQIAMIVLSTTQAGMRSVRVYRASTFSHRHGQACCWTICQYLFNMSNVKSSSFATFGLPRSFRRAKISFFRHFALSVAMISTSAISAKLKGFNCMLLKPQMRPTF